MADANLKDYSQARTLFNQQLKAEDKIRADIQEKIWDYYRGNKTQLEKYLKDRMYKLWQKDKVDIMLFRYILLTRKIVRALATVYNEPPVRKVVDSKNEENKELTAYYNSILPDKVNIIDKNVHRLGRALNTVFPRVSFNSEKGKFDITLNPTHLYIVIPSDNPLEPYLIAYDKYYNISDEQNLLTVIWTDFEHYAKDANGNKHYFDKEQTGKNIYEILPYLTVRFDDTDGDIFGEGLSTLVETNEILNIIATKFNLDDIIYGTTGILWGLNLGEITGTDQKKTDNPQQQETAEPTLSIGRDRIMRTNQRPQDNKSADLRWVSTNPQITEIIDALDWIMQSEATQHGINPHAMSVKNYPESGISKLVDFAWESIERVDDKETLRDYELQRFNLIKKMNNVLIAKKINGSDKLKNIPDGFSLTIDFKESILPLNISDKWTNRKESVQMNLKTPLDFMIEDNPDIKNKDEAKKEIEENMQFNLNNKTSDNQITNNDLII